VVRRLTNLHRSALRGLDCWGRGCTVRSVRLHEVLIRVAIPHLRNAPMRNAIYTLRFTFYNSDAQSTLSRKVTA